MQVQVPLGSVCIGPPAWRDGTVRSIRRAERIIRDTRAGRSAGARMNRSSSAGTPEETRDQVFRQKTRRPQTVTAPPPFPPSSLREQAAASSCSAAAAYTRRVREVEGALRRRAAAVADEGVRLERDRGHLDRMLRSIRTSTAVNRRSREGRSLRPHTAETDPDGADHLLLCERRELSELSRDLEETLKATLAQLQVLGETSRRLLDCAGERARVLDLMPHTASAGRAGSAQTRTDPVSPFTPECQQVLDSSSLTLHQSQLLRADIRRRLDGAIFRQKAAHRSVNDGLVKKISETVSLQQRLSVSSAAARQAVFRKQREIGCIRHSQGRAQGPESSGDVLSREKLDRPVVQVYQRHPGTQLPEAAQLIQGGAVLRRCLRSSEDQLVRLQRVYLQLLGDERAKMAAAQADAAVVRMRRQQVDRRAMPAFLQQGAL